MKHQAAVSAAVCLVMLLVASEMVGTSQAAGCDIFQLVPCMAASKNAHAVPSRQCCTNLANMGKGLPGAKCLCSLLSSSLAKSNGVVPRIALGIPQKCRIPVPKGFVCQGNAYITHPTLSLLQNHVHSLMQPLSRPRLLNLASHEVMCINLVNCFCGSLPRHCRLHVMTCTLFVVQASVFLEAKC
jgi:hypothetical protein